MNGDEAHIIIECVIKAYEENLGQSLNLGNGLTVWLAAELRRQVHLGEEKMRARIILAGGNLGSNFSCTDY